MAYWGRFNTANPTTLPVGGAFQPAGGRQWLVRFWELDGKYVGIAFPYVTVRHSPLNTLSNGYLTSYGCRFGIILTILFLFDHNVSVCMNLAHNMLTLTSYEPVINRTRIRIPIAKASRFPLGFFPPWYHYVFGRIIRCSSAKWSHSTSTYSAFSVRSIILIVRLIDVIQAPIHTQSLVILGYIKKDDDEKSSPTETETPTPLGIDLIPSGREPDFSERAIGVVEQRVSNLVQGSLCLVLMTGPFLHVLNLIPRGI